MHLLASLLATSASASADTCGDFDAAALVEDVAYANLADALRAAPRGSTVWICPGEWPLQAELDGARRLTLAGWSGDAADVVLSGEDSHRVLAVHGAGGLSLRDLTLAHGYSNRAGGAIFVQGASLVLERVVARDSQADSGGALAVADSASVVVRDSSFADNRAYAGGSIAVTQTERVTITGTTFADGSATYEGGELAFGDVVQVRLEDSTLSGSQAGFQGGGISLNAGALHVRATAFSFLSSEGDGGAIFATDVDDEGFADDVTVVIEDSSFQACQAGDSGGALRVQETLVSTIRISDSSFTDGWAEAYGGALALGSGGTYSALVQDSSFSDNASSQGGAIDGGTRGHGELALVGSHFAGNAASQGGAVALGDRALGLRFTASATTFDTNYATRAGGSAVHVGGRVAAAELELRDSLVVGNDGGQAALWLSATSRLSALRTDWAGGGDDNDPADVASPAFAYDDFRWVAELTCSGAGACSW